MLEKLGGSFENEVRGPPVIMNPRPAQNQNPNVVPGPEVIDDNTDDSSEEDSDDKTDDDEDMEQDNEETEQAPNAQIDNRNNESFELFYRDVSESDSD